ncbi:MAG: hypothetical protein ACFE9R_21050, partial [Candidatus Hermodarchaeota archaeon]
MQINRKLDFQEKKIIVRFSILGILLMSFLLLSFFQVNGNTSPQWKDSNFIELQSASNPEILFQGNEMALNITDYGNLYKYDQEISVSNQEEVNLTYYLDDVHNWEVSDIEFDIRNLQDERDWVNNSDFLAINVYQVNEVHQSAHNYIQNRDKSSTLNTISQSGAIAMRAHFTEVSFEDGWDFFFIEDENDVIQFTITGLGYTDFYSPWIRGTELNCYYESDNTYQYYGYRIDYYEFVNSSSNYEINSNNWSFDHSSTTETNYGSGYADNETAMFVSLSGDIEYDVDRDSTTYFDNDYTEIYQNITIPRGRVIDAYISFDYYAEYAMDSNENYIYFQINNNKVYSKGLGEINDLGKNSWHSIGLINMDLWSNTTNIFESIQENNEFNISVGIMSGATITYSGFEDQYQQAFWFDNISLILTTLANSSQSDIDLQFNSNPLIDGAKWGDSTLNLTGNWLVNPVTLTVTAESPSLSFELDTILYGFHNTKSRISQTINEGISFQILENGTIYWKLYHNFYMPAQYSDFEFIIQKPENWDFLTALDPTLQSRSFEHGGVGDII